MAGEDNTLTMVVLPVRCADREAAQRGLTLIYQIPKGTTDCDRWCHSQVIHNFYTGCPQPHESGRRPFPNAYCVEVSRIETVIFVATVLLTASAGTWLAVG
jgi:hypothetical protein